MTHRPSRRPAERATEREVGVVTAVVLAGSEEAAAQALSATPSVRSRKSLVWGEGMPTTDSASPGTRRYASSVTANTTDDSRRRRDASLMPQGMGAPADDAARMRPDRTLSPEGDAPLARRRGSLEPDHLEHDVTSALPRRPTCPSGSRPAARPLLRSTRPPRHPPDLRSRPAWRDPRRSGDWALPRNDLRGRAGRSPLTADRAPRTRSSEPQPFRQWAAGASVRDDLWTRVGAGLVDRGDDAASVGPRSTQPQRPVVPVLAGAALRPSGTPWRGASPRTPSPGTRSASPGACMVSPCRFRSPGCRAART